MMTCDVKLFADDAKIYVNVRSSMEKWAATWQMKFHPKKCTVMRIGKQHPPFTYNMHDAETGQEIELEQSHMEKDLRVYVDDDLSFSKHIQQCVAKANKIGGMI